MRFHAPSASVCVQALFGIWSLAVLGLGATQAEELRSRRQPMGATYEPTFRPPSGVPFSTTGPETEPDAEDYPHIFSTDVWNPNRFWYTERPNLLNQDVPDEWDGTKVINTDRPDFTDVATVVGPGVTQIESGYSFRRRSDAFTVNSLQTVPEILLRYGTSETFEWRIKWDLGYTNLHFEDRVASQATTLSGFSDVQLGFKWMMIAQDDWRPLQTIVTRLTVPTGSSEYSAHTAQPGFTYIYNWQVRRWWFFRGSSGVDWLTKAGPTFIGIPNAAPQLGIDRDYVVQGHQSVSSYMQISKRFGYYAEWFMLYRTATPDTRPDHYHNYGLYFYITPNFQLDIRIGERIGNGRVHEMFTGAGVSARF
jgi:hypothetical protein